ncbi:MAG: hypothetical protein HIU82_02075 [Proteobacteria bacterium]|nr:hypothetical protein [Pseudomonadota bacterium]
MSSFPPASWTPSPARTIRLWDYAGGAPIGRLPTVLPLRWPDKPAAAVLDYTLDVSALLAPGDAIATTAVTPSGVTMPASAVLGGRLIVWLAGGVSGTDNTIDITITTQSTRRIHRIVRLRAL